MDAPSRPRYMLIREISANYQNGNTLKAFTRNVIRSQQIAMSDDLEVLKECAEKYASVGIAPLYIDDWETGERVFKILKRGRLCE